MVRKPRKNVRARHPKYEQRLILFLDFLGFKEIVEGTVGTNNLDALLGAIDHLYEIGSDDKDLYSSACATTFSDLSASSYGVREQSAVFNLLLDIAYAVIGLVNRGFLVRGAVTIGELVHTKKYLVGPAMVRAYEMESKEAKFSSRPSGSSPLGNRAKGACKPSRSRRRREICQALDEERWRQAALHRLRVKGIRCRNSRHGRRLLL